MERIIRNGTPKIPFYIIKDENGNLSCDGVKHDLINCVLYPFDNGTGWLVDKQKKWFSHLIDLRLSKIKDEICVAEPISQSKEHCKLFWWAAEINKRYVSVELPLQNYNGSVEMVKLLTFYWPIDCKKKKIREYLNDDAFKIQYSTGGVYLSKQMYNTLSFDYRSLITILYEQCISVIFTYDFHVVPAIIPVTNSRFWWKYHYEYNLIFPSLRWLFEQYVLLESRKFRNIQMLLVMNAKSSEKAYVFLLEPSNDTQVIHSK